MARATTILKPREIMVRLARAWRPLFNDINSHYKVSKAGKVVVDKKIVEDMGIFSSLDTKLKDSFLQQLLADAKAVGEWAKDTGSYRRAQDLLMEIEALLKSIKREELVRKKQAKYLKRLASHLGGDVRKIERDVRREAGKAMRELEKTFKAKEKPKAKILQFPPKVEGRKIKKLAA